MNIARAAMIGDVVGGPGLEVLEAKLPELIKNERLDFVTVNGENAADGFGLTEADCARIFASGADVITSGNHVWEKRDFFDVLEREKKVLRPANYPASVPGAGFVLIEKNNLSWLVINLQGREQMYDIDCPFRCFDSVYNAHIGRANYGASSPARFPITLVDFHAESSREKEALAYYAGRRAALIAGTHTHVQTADERVLPKGGAYITDLGMTGVINSVIGTDPRICLERFRMQVLYHMEAAAANNSEQMQGVIAEIDADSCKALSIRRIGA
ncbi:MAG: YmdB family metallophosphoesterase [Treponema sp.]|jgi:metallophosphoesterase (TIGR00282 family)|nr:YmdB family metallophosphoesterase [Treponema sp.]